MTEGPVNENEQDPDGPDLSRNVLGTGITSALGDCTYETGQVLLPGFAAVLGIPPALIGLTEGIADAVMSGAKLLSGHIGNRWGGRKPLVLAGYALTPVGQALMAIAAGWPLILLGRVLGWLGKGLRGPLRDAILAASVAPGRRGRAFGFHRAMDTLGAIVGPALGIGLLELARHWSWPSAAGPYRFALGMTLVPGLLSVLVFAWLVRDPGSGAAKALPFWRSLRGLPLNFRNYLRAVALFGLGDFSHVLLVLAATTALTPAWGAIPAAQLAAALYIVRNIVQAVAAVPAGSLADRIGPLPVLRAGYLAGTLTAALQAAVLWSGTGNLLALGVVFVLGGVYMAIQETLEPVVTSELVAAELRPLALGGLGAVNGLAKLLASSLVGGLWSLAGPVAAFGAAGALMLAGSALLPARKT